MLKLAIVGSRSFLDYNYMKEAILNFIYAFPKSPEGRSICITEIVSGGARGADALAEQWAKDGHNIPLTTFPADWDKYGKSAGYKRNEQLVEYADMIMAFWDGESKGTKHTIDLAKKANKPVFIYTDWKK